MSEGTTNQLGGGGPLDPHDLFFDPAKHGLEPVAHGWGVFEFAELRGVYATRELAAEVLEECRARWRALPPAVLAPARHADTALAIRELSILDRRRG